MGRISVSTMVSLDGVIGDPRSWAMEYLDEAAQADGAKRLLLSEAMLLGRNTYQSLAAAWNGRQGVFASRLEAIPKYVFSNTLSLAEWGNVSIVRGDPSIEADRLRSSSSGNLTIFGHGRLTKTLIQAGLIDEIRLLIMPVLVGSGELIHVPAAMRRFELVQSTTLSNGVVILVHRRTEERA
ncbi:dihydrofolate reductase family protein [Mesorhizobium sp.]|uniref:dihydrofolate reductase family protein n=1 Tax=Mesorhizobium sp. TaxID=1871066 RepID=UPI000FE62B0B|nr:dihydrofolate reductase family protein [Mesorhizobium sp.]RWD69815.1 MAG: dihydrofolate reductase [Mesorhizobium sp.]